MTSAVAMWPTIARCHATLLAGRREYEMQLDRCMYEHNQAERDARRDRDLERAEDTFLSKSSRGHALIAVSSANSGVGPGDL